MDEKYFTIKDVAYHIGLEIYDDKGNECYVTCPYCQAKGHKANICVSKKGKRIDAFHCYGCDTSKNLYGLLADYYGVCDDGKHSRYQLARWQFLKELRIGGTQLKPTGIASIPTKKIEERPVEEIDDVYTTFHSLLKLSNQHKDNLLGRGLSEEDLMFFKSVPDRESSYSVCRALMKKGKKLNRVPGFFITQNNEWTVNHSFTGFLVPVANIKGQIIAYQVRLDKPLDGQKYVWLSSKNKQEGMTSGAPCGFYGNISATDIYFVDGILKALICSRLHKDKNVLFVGVAGVNNSRAIEEAIKELLKLNKTRRIVNAFDMDEFTNTICDHKYKKCKDCDLKTDICPHKAKKVNTLKKASLKLYNLSKKYGCEYFRAKWDFDNGIWNGKIKGLDDYIVSKIS